MATQYGAVNIITKYGQPSLDLQFSGPKKSLKNRMGDVEVEFTRSSVGTYVGSDGLIKTAVDDEARFDHDPVTGECLGLLVEESRTNEIPYSEDFTHSSWTNVNVTVTSNNTTAPDGTLNAADRLQIGATNGVIYNNTVGGVTSNSTISVWIKAVSPGTSDVFRLGSAGSLSADITATNQWTRYTYTSTTFTSSLHGIVRPSDNTAADIYVWGAQFEENKTFPTSYIPTSGSELTRSADIAQITGDNFSSWYGGLAGTYIVEALNKTTSNQYPIVCDDGTTGTRILFATSGAYQLQIRISGSTSVQLDAQPGAGQPQGMTKYAGSYSPDGASVAYSGVSNTDSTADIPQCSRLQIGQFSGNTYDLTIARISYYPTRLTDEQLQELTQ